MQKKLLTLIAISSVFLLIGCNNPKQDLGGFLGELSCITAETNGQTETEAIAEMANNNGFETETSIQELVASLDQADLDKEIEQAADHITANCQEKFEEAGIDATEFLEKVLQYY